MTRPFTAGPAGGGRRSGRGRALLLLVDQWIGGRAYGRARGRAYGGRGGCSVVGDAHRLPVPLTRTGDARDLRGYIRRPRRVPGCAESGGPPALHHPTASGAQALTPAPATPP